MCFLHCAWFRYQYVEAALPVFLFQAQAMPLARHLDTPAKFLQYIQ
jgi:hypothetical protein